MVGQKVGWRLRFRKMWIRGGRRRRRRVFVVQHVVQPDSAKIGRETYANRMPTGGAARLVNLLFEMHEELIGTSTRHGVPVWGLPVP